MEGGKQRLNGETIAGMALVFMGLLFTWAGTMNPVWELIRPAAYLILAIGVGFMVIGALAIRRTNHPSTQSGHSGRY
jgi:carbon starvation protein CstA